RRRLAYFLITTVCDPSPVFDLAMPDTPAPFAQTVSPSHVAPQHGPRPLPLFLALLWRETEGDPLFRKRAFAGLRRFQNASRSRKDRPGVCVATEGRAKLIQYEP